MNGKCRKSFQRTCSIFCQVTKHGYLFWSYVIRSVLSILYDNTQVLTCLHVCVLTIIASTEICMFYKTTSIVLFRCFSFQTKRLRLNAAS